MTETDLAKLLPPDPTYPYLQHAAKFPFQKSAAGFHAINAGWLADLSFLAYMPDKNFIRDKLRERWLNLHMST